MPGERGAGAVLPGDAGGRGGAAGVRGGLLGRGAAQLLGDGRVGRAGGFVPWGLGRGVTRRAGDVSGESVRAAERVVQRERDGALDDLAAVQQRVRGRGDVHVRGVAELGLAAGAVPCGSASGVRRRTDRLRRDGDLRRGGAREGLRRSRGGDLSGGVDGRVQRHLRNAGRVGDGLAVRWVSSRALTRRANPVRRDDCGRVQLAADGLRRDRVAAVLAEGPQSGGQHHAAVQSGGRVGRNAAGSLLGEVGRGGAGDVLVRRLGHHDGEARADRAENADHR